MKPTLIYYDILSYQPENMEMLRKHFQVIELPDPDSDTPEILERAEVVLAPLGYYFGPEKIDMAPRLRCIGSNTTGHPHIDVEYARRKGVAVVTLKDHQDFLDTITPTSELTFGLLIALTRKIIPAYQSVIAGNWSRWPFGGESMLSRMHLGVAGLGRLGKKVAAYGLAFGMKVRYYDPFVEPPQKLEVERSPTLEHLVETSDVVTIHIPHERETENLFDAGIISRFKQGAFLINTSRGELVDHQALLEALLSGKLGGAALDVLDGEFEPGFQERVLENPLVRYARNHDNLILTPHIGGSTRDAWRLTQRYTIEKIMEALSMIETEDTQP